VGEPFPGKKSSQSCQGRCSGGVRTSTERCQSDRLLPDSCCYLGFRLGKREVQLCVIGRAVVGKAMRVNDRAERVGIQREEEGTQDGDLKDPNSERTRISHRSSPAYPISAVVEVG